MQAEVRSEHRVLKYILTFNDFSHIIVEGNIQPEHYNHWNRQLEPLDVQLDPTIANETSE